MNFIKNIVITIIQIGINNIDNIPNSEKTNTISITPLTGSIASFQYSVKMPGKNSKVLGKNSRTIFA